MRSENHINSFLRKIIDNKKFFDFAGVVSKINNAKVSQITEHFYTVNGKDWTVVDSPDFKIILETSAGAYNEFYDKSSGYTLRFGKTLEEDPEFCEIGNTISDIEVVSGKCPKINGKNCRFCYKSNGGDAAECMSLDSAEKLLDFVNQNNQLEQVAWGITGFYTNPDFERILESCKKRGITPNYTTNGADIDDHAIDVTLKNCGRVAVSCYEGAKDLCYSTLKRFGDAATKAGKRFSCNIHVVLAKDTYAHVMDVLNDAKSGNIENLGAVVMLRIKNVGRASSLDPVISDETYEKIIDFCLKNDIRFGFDSCGCKKVESVFRKMNRADLISSIEPCESSRFSGYFNVRSEYFNCSFCEQLKEHKAINPYAYNTYSEFWNSAAVKDLRNPKNGWACPSCPFLKLD